VLEQNGAVGVEAEPLAGGAPAVEAASVSAYRTGLGVGGGLVVLGGVISLIGIVNPRRGAERHDELGAVRIAQPCPDERAAA
jgi:hypothetical protein